ncbi:LysR substrate-binding domain-containing protein [Rhizobium sp. Leaf386]|uniref:LysR substrate-binding domain-containing protein n=1 Tax=Rhizobium sp. Leaf386 TaxID=1736359 RepID=UPI000713712F|nr:LysR substrate-binding domain-containing protein [Rhizobium sp. Leaf386]KQT05055.1 hypothetical protein ASG50_15400 [Rhizobium sp. Leaf386]
MRDLSELKTGLVRIAAPPLLGATVLPKLISEVEKDHPNLKIRIEDVPTEVILTQVRSGLCDLGVGTFGSDQDGIDTMRVLKDRLMAFVVPQHEFRSHKEVDCKREFLCAF